MRSRMFLMMLISLTLLLMWATAPAAALTGRQIISINITCENIQIFYDESTFDRDNSGMEMEVIEATITDGAGNVIHSFQNFVPVGITTPPSDTALGFSPLPVANPIHIRLVSIAGNGYDEQEIWNETVDCPDLPPSTPPATPPAAPPAVPNAPAASGFTDVGIPSGFVMHYIACTTPVYTEPAGVPVGNDRVLEGQTWFVDPAPVEGADGQLWTEIFVGSSINPWIPTACVGGVAPLTP